MKLVVKLFASLREGRAKEILIERSGVYTPKTIIKELNIPEEDVAIIMINGRRSEADIQLNEGDTVSLFPPVGGG
ncbi:MAG TPA: MoaD/ThiS family protein [Clostridia bacterium]|nr:MoaD/ThiS family protein [Clostridia bacterium]HOR13197.1 MoaD/ThiS family protein [Clostridia bacterium]